MATRFHTTKEIFDALSDRLPSGYTWSFDMGRAQVVVDTPLEMPDGDGITLFVQLNVDGRLLVTDHGETLGWLRTVKFDLELPEEWSVWIEQVISSNGISYDDRANASRLEIWCDDIENVADSVKQLTEAIHEIVNGNPSLC